MEEFDKLLLQLEASNASSGFPSEASTVSMGISSWPTGQQWCRTQGVGKLEGRNQERAAILFKVAPLFAHAP